jgi:PAS domain S-box-containing protein
MNIFHASNMAIIGGGRFCRSLLELLLSSLFDDERPQILGVADINPKAEGMRLAAERGIFTTGNYRDLINVDDLELLLDLSDDIQLAETIQRIKPSGVHLVDRIDARSIWTRLLLETEKRKILHQIGHDHAPEVDPITLFTGFADRLMDVIDARNRRYEEIERNLLESQRATAQLVEGSTIPTFVINHQHVVTHWNRACEKLTGFSAEQIVGTRDQWKPFRKQKRPIMADLILDGVSEEEVWRYYGTKWRKSALIEGAYEAEEYFAHLGENGKWLYFTAAPIKGPDGTRIGAIETLWDRTEDKRAAAEREEHNRKLAAKTEQLQASQQTMTQIIEGSTMPTFVIDADHKITHWNTALARLTGYQAKEMVGTRRQWEPFWEHERPSMADVIVDQYSEEAIEGLYGHNWRRSSLIDNAFEAESFFPKMGKQGKWCWFTAAPLLDAEQRIIGAIETIWDKTEDKKHEQERERHNWELATLCNIYSALVAPLDVKGRIKTAIEEIQQLLDADGVCLFTAEDGRALVMRFGHGICDEVRKDRPIALNGGIMPNVARGDKLCIFEDVARVEDDQFRHLHDQGVHSVACMPLAAREKKTFGLLNIYFKAEKHFSDEEEHVLELVGNRIAAALENYQLQSELRKSETKYRSLFNNDPNPIFILDPLSVKILDVNQRARDVYGYTRADLIGRSFFDLGAQDDEELHDGLRTMLPNQTILFAKRRHLRKDQWPIYVNINVIYAKYGENDALIATTTDITESIEKETQLIQASKMTTLGQMASGIAHEINQPLNVIQINADYLKKMLKRGKRPADEDLGAITDDISANVQRATGIIRHMRDFARQSDVVATKVNLNDPIEDIFKVLGHQIKSHNISVQLELDPKLPEILAQHNRLEQVFINLVTNAIDAMDEQVEQNAEKGAEKILKIRTFAEAGEVVATVSDNGIGMRPEVREKIFEPFFTTKAVGKGTGLGVSISYGIVRDYAGTIEIDSNPGQGTTFQLRFPAVTAEEADSRRRSSIPTS